MSRILFTLVCYLVITSAFNVAWASSEMESPANKPTNPEGGYILLMQDGREVHGEGIGEWSHLLSPIEVDPGREIESEWQAFVDELRQEIR